MAGYVPGEQPRDGEYLKLNTNECPYGPSPAVFEAIREHLTSDRLRKYPEPMGNTFRQAAGKVLGIDPDSILIGNGSDDVLTILTRAFVPEGGLIASPTPSYILYESLARIQGARFRTVPFTADWQLPEQWPEPNADLTFLPNPNSPSGTVIPLDRVRRLAEEVGTLVLDEAYADFADQNGLALASKNIIVTRSFSKSYALAGIRFGMAIADPSIIRELLKVKDSYNCDVLSLAAATAAILDQEDLQMCRTKIIATRTRMARDLTRLGFHVTPSQANFLWTQRTDRPHTPIYEALRERKILIRYMNYPGFGDGLRMTVGSDDEADRLIDALIAIL